MGISYSLQKKLIVFGFLTIPISLLMLFMFYPTIKIFQLSLTNWDGYSDAFQYVGLENFRQLILKSNDVWIALRNNSYYLFIHLLAIPFEIGVAVILCGKIRGSKFFKSVTFLPYVINGVAVALTFSYLYSPNGGAFNAILDFFQLSFLKMGWLSNIYIVNFVLVSVSLWRFCGLHVILFIAAILSIPTEYYEAASIDGANSFQKFTNITIPGIKTVLELILFLNVRGALSVFDIPFLMTNGGPGYETSTFMVYTIKTAFQFNQYGLASAMAIVLMILIIIFGYVQSKIIKIKG